MPTPSEQKTVQAKIVELTEVIGGPFCTGRRGASHGGLEASQQQNTR